MKTLLDESFIRKYKECNYELLEKAIQHTKKNKMDFSVAELALQLSISRQHLNRLFKQHLGVSVKKFHDIVLFRESLNEKVFNDTSQDLTSIAYGFNYYDQSHFIKTYKNLTSYSPKIFFKKGSTIGKEDTFWHFSA